MKKYSCSACGNQFEHYLQSGGKTPKFCSVKCYGIDKSNKTYEQIMGRELAAKRRKELSNSMEENNLTPKDGVKNLGNFAKKGATPWNKGKGVYKSYTKVAIDHRKGKFNHFWKGGIRRKHGGSDYIQRRIFKIEMQKIIFERDNYTCQICGIRGVDLQVDHIQPWAKYVEGRFDINNCRTLCAKCHYKITFGKEMPSTLKGWGHHFLERRILQ